MRQIQKENNKKHTLIIIKTIHSSLRSESKNKSNMDFKLKH